MEWSFVDYLAFLAGDGWLSLLLLGTTTVALITAGKPNRKLVAGAPGILSLAVFALSCFVASIFSDVDPGAYAHIPIFGLLCTVLLVVPSVLALSNRWWGLLHGLTLLASGYLCFISVLAIRGDAI